VRFCRGQVALDAREGKAVGVGGKGGRGYALTTDRWPARVGS
jgi:hypothetical protein